MWLRTLRWISLDHLGWSEFPYKRERCESGSRRCDSERNERDLKMLHPWFCRWRQKSQTQASLEAGKTEDSSLEPPGGNQHHDIQTYDSPGLDNNTFVLFGALEFWVVHNSSHWKYTHRKSLLLAHLSIQVMIRTFLLWASMIPWGSSQPCTIQEKGCGQASYERSRLPIFFILLIHLFLCGPFLGFGLPG